MRFRAVIPDDLRHLMRYGGGAMRPGLHLISVDSRGNRYFAARFYLLSDGGVVDLQRPFIGGASGSGLPQYRATGVYEFNAACHPPKSRREVADGERDYIPLDDLAICGRCAQRVLIAVHDRSFESESLFWDFIRQRSALPDERVERDPLKLPNHNCDDFFEALIRKATSERDRRRAERRLVSTDESQISIRPKKPQVTYFIQGNDGGPIKIGKTGRDVSERLRDHQSGSPVRLEVVGVVHRDIEAELHKKFESIRLHGEWFRPEQSLIDEIRRLTK